MSTRTLPPGTILPVSGVSFRQDSVAACHEGQGIVLRHDVSNAHDKWAVAVETSEGNALGFVPAKGGLAQRLSENTPGGVWKGTICEVLRGETVGLRIRLDGLVEQRSTQPGSDRKGVRGIRDGVDENGRVLESASSDTGSEAAVSLGRGTVVRGPGGRELGELLERSETLVRVAAADGSLRAYPAALVTID